MSKKQGKPTCSYRAKDTPRGYVIEPEPARGPCDLCAIPLFAAAEGVLRAWAKGYINCCVDCVPKMRVLFGQPRPGRTAKSPTQPTPTGPGTPNPAPDDDTRRLPAPQEGDPPNMDGQYDPPIDPSDEEDASHA